MVLFAVHSLSFVAIPQERTTKPQVRQIEDATNRRFLALSVELAGKNLFLIQEHSDEVSATVAAVILFFGCSYDKLFLTDRI